MERMVRRWRSISGEEVQKKFEESTPEQYGSGGLQGDYMPAYSEKLIGKIFDFTFDDYETCSYCFTGLHELTWRQGAECHEEYYQGHEAEEGIWFVHHVIKGSCPPQARTLVIDENTGLVTLIHAQFGNGCEAREVARTFHFGRIAGADSTAKLHHFTDELVGVAIQWTYFKDRMAIKHIYSSEYYYTYVMQLKDLCWMASNPADFVKISDHLYLFSFLEERQAGTQAVFLINMDTLHDVGSFLGINSEEQFESYTIGAKGERSTMETYIGQ